MQMPCVILSAENLPFPNPPQVHEEMRERLVRMDGARTLLLADAR
jgi:hypothetical protein